MSRTLDHYGRRAREWFAGEPGLARLTFVLPLLAYVVIYFVDGTGFHPNGDGFYSWLFARSLAFDGDFDFANDYALCGDPFHVAVDRGTGHLDNPFYVGPAVFWIVPLAVLRLVGSASASCGGWLTAIPILAGPICGAAAVWFSYRAARLLVSPRVAASTALFFAFSSPLFPYSSSIAQYSHVYLTCMVAGLTFVSLRIIIEGYRPRDGLWIGLAIMLAILQRLPAALYAVVAASALVALLRHPKRTRLVMAIGAGGMTGIALTCLLYQYLYGKWIALPQGPYYVQLAHAHPWLVLFGVHGGFFFWMPAAWLALPGVWLAIRRSQIRWFAVACLIASVVEIFVSSAAVDWQGNWSLGARRLVPLTPFVIVFASVAVERLRVRLGERRWIRPLAIAVVGLTLVNNIPAATTIRGDRDLSQRELYGALSPLYPLWAGLDHAGVDLALLPGELYFAIRYGLPMKSYRDVLALHYGRHFRFLTFENAELDLRQPAAKNLMTGAAWSERGMDVSTTESRLVFTVAWPFATHMRLLVSGDAPTELRIGHRTLGGRSPVGVVHVPTEPSWVEVEIPPGIFDSGINDWTFQTETGHTVIAAISFDDRTPRVPYN